MTAYLGIQMLMLLHRILSLIGSPKVDLVSQGGLRLGYKLMGNHTGTYLKTPM